MKELFPGFLVPVTSVQCPGVLVGMIMCSSWRDMLCSPLKLRFGWSVRNREWSHPRVC